MTEKEIIRKALKEIKEYPCTVFEAINRTSGDREAREYAEEIERTLSENGHIEIREGYEGIKRAEITTKGKMYLEEWR